MDSDNTESDKEPGSNNSFVLMALKIAETKVTILTEDKENYLLNDFGEGN